MKYWLIMFFLSPDGEFVSKREVAYPNEVECYKAMDGVRPKNGLTVQFVCVSDDHHSGKKQDPGVNYD